MLRDIAAPLPAHNAHSDSCECNGVTERYQRYVARLNYDRLLPAVGTKYCVLYDIIWTRIQTINTASSGYVAKCSSFDTY